MKKWLVTAFFCMVSVSGLAVYECESGCESIGLGGGGYLCGGGGTTRDEAFEDIVGSYSYDEICGKSDYQIDPITMIVRSPPDPAGPYDEYVIHHLDHHGLDNGPSGALGDQLWDQHFRDGNLCMGNDITQASEGVINSRWHARGSTQTWITDPYASQSRVSALTPHWDQLAWPFQGCDWNGGHFVPEDFYNNANNVSGFVAARDHVAQEWVISGHHDFISIYNFKNRDVLIQCNGDAPRSDGIVYHLY